MAEQLDTHEYPQQTPRELLAGAKYWLDQYIAQDTDPSSLAAAGELIDRALGMMPEESETDILNKGFEVSSLSREDLVSQGIPKSIVLSLDDEEMVGIARRMGDMHVEYGGYWTDLEHAFVEVLKARVNVTFADVWLAGFKDEKGKFKPEMAGHGTYFMDSLGSLLCFECANAPDEDHPVIAGDINFDDDTMSCSSCDRDIPIEYKAPDPTVPYETNEDLNKEGDRPESDLLDTYET